MIATFPAIGTVTPSRSTGRATAAPRVQTPWHEPRVLADLDLLAGGDLAVEAAAVGEREGDHLQCVASGINVIAGAREHAARGARPPPAGPRLRCRRAAGTEPGRREPRPRGVGPGRARARPGGSTRKDRTRPARAAGGSTGPHGPRRSAPPPRPRARRRHRSAPRSMSRRVRRTRRPASPDQRVKQPQQRMRRAQDPVRRRRRRRHLQVALGASARREEGPVTSTSTDRAGEPPPPAPARVRAGRQPRADAGPRRVVGEGSRLARGLLAGQPPTVAQLLVCSRPGDQRASPRSAPGSPRRRRRRPARPRPARRGRRDKHGAAPAASRTASDARPAVPQRRLNSARTIPGPGRQLASSWADPPSS